MNKKILVVVTNVAKYPDINRETGLWLGEVVHFVNKVEAAGYEVDYVSPKGGHAPIDPHSLEQAEPIEKQWYQNKVFMNRLETTLKPSDIHPEDYVAIYYVGGHGALWDFPDNEALQAISQSIYEQGGYISSVCHGAAGLLNIKLAGDALLLEGITVTGFSNAEEKLIGLDRAVPYLIEDELIVHGGVYQKAGQVWAPYVVKDDRVITGQNPASGEAVANLLIATLKGDN